MNNNMEVTDGHLFKGMRTWQLEDNNERESFSEYLYIFDVLIIINYLKIYK